MRMSLRSMLLLVTLLAFGMYSIRVLYLSVLPVPPRQLAQLKLGMSPLEVLQIIGEPHETACETWTYARHFDFGFVHVYYEDQARLIGTDPEPTEFYYSYP